MRTEELFDPQEPMKPRDWFSAGLFIAVLIAMVAGTAGIVSKAPAQSHAAPAIAERPVPTLPAPMIRVPAFVDEVHDGDTLTVSVDFSMKIRLIDCWAPELKDGVKGQVSKANLIKLTSKNQRCMVEIPLHDDLGKSTSLGRILGRVTVIGQDSDLSTQQVQGGFATKTKGQRR